VNAASARMTIGASANPAVVHGMRAKNNGRYNGNGRNWQTPPEIFEPLEREFRFTLDPCATASSAKCERFYTESDNGLTRSWSGERVFMNPPYGREIYAWTRKAREESRGGRWSLVFFPLPAIWPGGTRTSLVTPRSDTFAAESASSPVDRIVPPASLLP